MATFEQYYDANPMGAIDRNQWTEWDPVINVAFHDHAIFSPLIQWADMSPQAKLLVTGRELLPGHVNHNAIALRQKYISAAYMDSRERKIKADKRYGGKVQYDAYDQLINQWRLGGRQGFADGILRQHLNRSILITHEKLARDATLNNANVVSYAGGATNFAGLLGTSDYKFIIEELRQVDLRLSVRVKDAMLQWGQYDGAPVPGVKDKLVITTPGVVYDIWDQMDSRYMMDLRDLGDQRIINGGAVRYKGWTIVEDWDAALWNAGPLVKQVAITSPVTAGDGALDPDADNPLDATYYVGQGSAGVTHYVQCSDLGTSQFKVGDFITLHTAKTNANGVTDGVDALDGQTMVLEIARVDEVNERLTFRMPVMDDYNLAFTGTPNGGAAQTCYGFITKGAHIHPLYQMGARGHSLFAFKRRLALHNPPAVDDFEAVTRVSWDEYGSVNKWQGDLHEVHYVRASFGNRDVVGV
jgi:hypothetical protein